MPTVKPDHIKRWNKIRENTNQLLIQYRVEHSTETVPAWVKAEYLQHDTKQFMDFVAKSDVKVSDHLRPSFGLLHPLTDLGELFLAVYDAAQQKVSSGI